MDQTANSTIQKPVSRTFSAADWHFRGCDGGREFHPYPARFIPEIPRQALEILGVDGPVIDPFCGSGTTLAEAQRRGLQATGVDLNPIACLISRVRTSAWGPGDASDGLRHAVELQARAAAGGDVSVLEREIPRLDHWFTPAAASALAGAVKYLEEVPTPWQDRISLAISASVVRLSRQESDTRYAAVENHVTQAGAAVELGQSVVRMCDWLANRTTQAAPGRVNVLCQDSTDLSNLPQDYYAAAVFSPPYPNAYEYWLYHKYRMYWLGFDPVSVRQRELGARPHYCKNNGLTEDDFAAQMTDVFQGLTRALQASGRVVVVIGDSVIGGRHIDNGNLIAEVATSSGYALEAWARRDIRRTRSSFNRAHGRGRREEHVMLFRRS